MVIGNAELGASGKNMLPNLTLIRHTLFDWLDEVFLQPKEKRRIKTTTEVATVFNT